MPLCAREFLSRRNKGTVFFPAKVLMSTTFRWRTRALFRGQRAKLFCAVAVLCSFFLCFFLLLFKVKKVLKS